MRTAGSEGSANSVVRHIGRTTGTAYETPVVAVEHDDGFLIALPYGGRTDWVKNVCASGRASVVSHGHSHDVDRPEIVPMAGVTQHFGPKEQKLHRRFAVDTCLRVRRQSR